jgi:hypothetical protein
MGQCVPLYVTRINMLILVFTAAAQPAIDRGRLFPPLRPVQPTVPWVQLQRLTTQSRPLLQLPTHRPSRPRASQSTDSSPSPSSPTLVPRRFSLPSTPLTSTSRRLNPSPTQPTSVPMQLTLSSTCPPLITSLTMSPRSKVSVPTNRSLINSTNNHTSKI